MQALPYPAIKGEEGAAIRAVESRIFADASFSPSEKIVNSIRRKAQSPRISAKAGTPASWPSLLRR
jgi:hypothetical protein